MHGEGHEPHEPGRGERETDPAEPPDPAPSTAAPAVREPPVPGPPVPDPNLSAAAAGPADPRGPGGPAGPDGPAGLVGPGVPGGLVSGAFVVDGRTGRVGRVVDVAGIAVRLRPPGGGAVWECPRESLCPASPGVVLRARVTEINRQKQLPR